MNIKWISRTFFIPFIVCVIGTSYLCGDDTQSVHHAQFVEFTIDAEHSDYADIIDASLADPFLLKKLTYESDVLFQQAEFHYLMGIREGSIVTSDELKEGFSYLVKKRQFETIGVSFTPLEDGYHVHITIKGGWILNKVVLHGLLLGKDRYRQYYSIEPGDLFDTASHERSLQKIKEVFASEGYFNARVESRLDYDEDTKTVKVHIWLGHNQHFFIHDVQLTIHGEVYIDDNEKQLLQINIEKQFLQKLRKTSYSKQLLNEQAETIRRYLMRRGYVNADIELKERVDRVDCRVNIDMTIRLHKKRMFVFVGNTFFSHDQLLDSMIVFGRSSCLLPASFLAEEIIKSYKSSGFWQINVETREEASKYFFIINEGKRAYITDVCIEGAHHVSHIKLIKQYFAEILKNSWYDEAPIQRAMDGITDWYVQEGFLECCITKYEYISQADDAYLLRITLDEGERSYFGDVHVEGHSELHDVGPFRVLNKYNERIPFNMDRVNLQRTWLINHFKRKGYLSINLKPDIVRDGYDVTLTWRMDANTDEAVRFGKVVVQGAGAFPFEYMLREMTFTHGELWDRTKIKDSLTRLKKLDVFEMVHMYPHDIAKHEREKAVMVKVQQDDRYEARMRAGFAFQQVSKEWSFYRLTYRAGGSFLIKNPFNCGDRISLDIDASQAESKLIAEYHRPWLGSIPIEAFTQIYNNRFQQPGAVGNRKNLYQVLQTGTLFGVRKEFGVNNAGGNIGFEWMKTTISDRELFADRVAQAINFEPDLLDRHIPFFMFQPSLTIDHVDNRLQPTRGVFLLYSLKAMVPMNRVGTNSYFVKILLEQSFYLPCYPIVLAFRVRVGHIFHKDFSSIMPSERFYLGGANSLRGYERDLAPPLGKFVDEKRGVQYVPQGGKSMANFIFEIRFPLYKKLGAVIFEDIGALSSNAFYDFKERGALAATGFGVRYDLPIGPLRFDIGWRWKATDPVTPSYAWFVTLGHAF